MRNLYEIPKDLLAIQHPYPDVEKLAVFLRNYKEGDHDLVLKEFIRLWFTEGVPWAFRDCPWLYERVRTIISKDLSIEFNGIFMIGSGKLRWSLRWSLSQDRVLKEFNFCNPSDLDFTIVNDGLFQRMKTDFEEWKKLVESGVCTLKDDWENNNMNKRLPSNIKEGFIDMYKLPVDIKELKTRQLFPDLVVKLGKLFQDYLGYNFPNKRSHMKITFRIYQNWESFLKQNLINLNNIQRKIKL